MEHPKSNPDTPQDAEKNTAAEKPEEIGGRPADQPDPVIHGDWSKAGRCIDF
jgi:hypothetical protein